MSERRGPRRLFPEAVSAFPSDLAAAIAVVVLTGTATLLPGDLWSALRVVFGLPTLFLLPGYVLVAALFPERRRSERASDAGGTFVPRVGAGLDGLERLALSFGLSLAVVPLVALLGNFVGLGLRPDGILLSVSGYTVAGAVAAALRRWELPASERYRVSYGRWYAATKAALTDADSSADRVLNVALALSILLATGSVAYAIAAPKPAEQFTELYLLSENEDGKPVAEDYPREFIRGQSQQLVVGIQNHEGERERYTVIVRVQRRTESNGSSAAVAERELHRFQTVLGPGERWNRTHAVRPTVTGELRLQYLIYRESIPSDPRAANADEEVHLPIVVDGKKGQNGTETANGNGVENRAGTENVSDRSRQMGVRTTVAN